jgi:SOS-response transcriptional repressor LexA
MQTLTPKQQAVYDTIAKHQQEQGYTPTLRTIGEMMGVSHFTVAVHLRKVIEKERARRVATRHIELM